MSAAEPSGERQKPGGGRGQAPHRVDSSLVTAQGWSVLIWEIDTLPPAGTGPGALPGHEAGAVFIQDDGSGVRESAPACSLLPRDAPSHLTGDPVEIFQLS